MDEAAFLPCCSPVIDLTEQGEAGRPPAGAAKHPCPVCHRIFAESAIDMHVDQCLNVDGGGAGGGVREEEEEEDRMPTRRRRLFTSKRASKGAGQGSTEKRQMTLKSFESASPTNSTQQTSHKSLF